MHQDRNSQLVNLLKKLPIPLVSGFMINLDFYSSYTAHFDESMILPFFVFTYFGFFVTFFYTSNSAIALFSKESKLLKILYF